MTDIGPKTKAGIALIAIGIAGCIGSALAGSSAGSVMSIITASFGILVLM